MQSVIKENGQTSDIIERENNHRRSCNLKRLPREKHQLLSHDKSENGLVKDRLQRLALEAMAASILLIHFRDLFHGGITECFS